MYGPEAGVECRDGALAGRILEAYGRCAALTGGLGEGYGLRVLAPDEFVQELGASYGFDPADPRRERHLLDEGLARGYAFPDEALVSGGSGGDAVRLAVHEAQGHGYLFRSTRVGRSLAELWDDEGRYNVLHRSCAASGEGFATWLEQKHVEGSGPLGPLRCLLDRYELWLGSLLGREREYHLGSTWCRRIEREFGERSVAVALRAALDLDVPLELSPAELEAYLAVPEHHPDRRLELLASLDNPGIAPDDVEGVERIFRGRLGPG